MNSISADTYQVHFNATAYHYLNTYLAQHQFTNIVIIVDTNTHIHCLSKFLQHVETTVSIEIIEFNAGEIHKTIETCVQIWSALSDIGADRNSLIINLGGGVVTDLGGFVACTYMRGVRYINVPTSLLAMVDASVGGKTGVDLGVLKNQVGIISNGEMVLIDTSFLSTLPQRQLKSGLSEMLKHGLISDFNYWNILCDLGHLTLEDLDDLIYKSVQIKNKVVNHDMFENGVRKILNFGHTLGHAIESYHLSVSDKTTLLHGEAIAIGMILESYLSHLVLHLPIDELNTIKKAFLHSFEKVTFTSEDITAILKLLKHDKKNKAGQVKFVLLEAIGTAKIDCEVSEEQIVESFAYYEKAL